MIEWICLTCSFNEQLALKKFQEQGITDRLALATVMASVKQESKFIPNICEGGARVKYENCHRGGYGIIQWTTKTRYDNLGKFCKRYDCDPSSINGQLRYLTTEPQWRKALLTLRQNNLSFSRYYGATYSWLGWGIAGPRKQYTYQYFDKLSQAPKDEPEQKIEQVETSSRSETRELGFFEKLWATFGIKG